MKILTCLGLSTAITWLELVSAMASLLSSKCGYVSQVLDFIGINPTESNGYNLVIFITDRQDRTRVNGMTRCHVLCICYQHKAGIERWEAHGLQGQSPPGWGW